MPTITVIQGEDQIKIPYTYGKSLKEILNSEGNLVNSGCRGNGACGLCRVRIEDTYPAVYSSLEQFHLSKDEQRSRVHLSCQVFPLKDLTITILNSGRKSDWNHLEISDYQCKYRIEPADDLLPDTLLGAVDIGTTSISIALCQPRDGKIISACGGINPQSQIGPDIITRLTRARDSDEDAKILQRSVISSIATGQYRCLLHDPIPGRTVRKIFVTGNTAMLALLNRKGLNSLLSPDAWDTDIDVISNSKDAWYNNLGLHNFPDITLIPPIGGFIGSDIIAGVIHTRLMDSPGPSLFIDFGTNTEIVLWDGTVLWTTSASGGPAFEGEGISCGMAAESGAIYRLDSVSSSSQWTAKVIHDRRVKGICGSGLIDMVALLISSGQIDTMGRIIKNNGYSEISLPISGCSLSLNKSDINILQQAKAAIGAGISVLCRMASITLDQLNQVYVGGTFGMFLQIDNAISIGLLPPVSPVRVTLFGNTSLSGCLDLALSAEAREICNTIRRTSKVVNLAHSPLFENYYLTNLYLCPIRSSSGE